MNKVPASAKPTLSPPLTVSTITRLHVFTDARRVTSASPFLGMVTTLRGYNFVLTSVHVAPSRSGASVNTPKEFKGILKNEESCEKGRRWKKEVPTSWARRAFNTSSDWQRTRRLVIPGRTGGTAPPISAHATPEYLDGIRIMCRGFLTLFLLPVAGRGVAYARLSHHYWSGTSSWCFSLLRRKTHPDATVDGSSPNRLL